MHTDTLALGAVGGAGYAVAGDMGRWVAPSTAALDAYVRLAYGPGAVVAWSPEHASASVLRAGLPVARVYALGAAATPSGRRAPLRLVRAVSAVA